ncbi:hypothetical protein [Robbsia andropogonis]|uniref:hypothetical protein n=1 Tax=Robbsia andropogonis TaxID=28092 RepID=UPI00209F1716|nr:hypothetical protein [Robbsia andropogonis]MCP1119050.1 hypothetical protein [Robbsia andropogonis]MCP1128598.1 hypothetical protein [Robbsia andropogonis]
MSNGIARASSVQAYGIVGGLTPQRGQTPDARRRMPDAGCRMPDAAVTLAGWLAIAGWRRRERRSVVP